MSDCVEITTGSRLHFGPLFCGRTSGRRFGGVGAMIDRPRCRVRVSRAPTGELVAPDEIRDAVLNCVDAIRRCGSNDEPLRIEVHESIPRHRGLGSGTQTAVAIAQGIQLLTHGEPADAETLARMTGRGVRSAIGIHGFQRGGFLIDGGKRDEDSLGSLAARCDVPDEWRFVLIAPHEATGLSGRSERDALTQLRPMAVATSAELCRIALTELLPAAQSGDFAAFSEGLFEYGRIVGDYFCPAQGGCFSHRDMARLAEGLRRDGIAGVAQSSWGPTIAAFVRDEASARELVRSIATNDRMWCEVAQPLNCGATIRSAGY